MTFTKLSNDQLHTQTKAAANNERLSTIEVLWLLKENEKRMLYAQMGYRDLKEYCIKELKYSEGSAWRRISAARLLREVPQVEEKIKAGDLNLTQISMARAHFRETKATVTEKHEILLSLENQSTKSTERILAEKKPQNFDQPKIEVKEKAIKGNKLEVTLVLDQELQNELEEIQVLLGKRYSKLELLKLLAKEKLQGLKKQSSLKAKHHNEMNCDNQTECKSASSQDSVCDAQPSRSTGAVKPTIRSRHIPLPTVREVKARDQHRCQYKDPNSGRQCDERYNLQLEHRLPFAQGGTHEPENLQLLCWAHNRLRAIQQYGTRKMAAYMQSLT